MEGRACESLKLSFGALPGGASQARPSSPRLFNSLRVSALPRELLNESRPHISPRPRVVGPAVVYADGRVFAGWLGLRVCWRRTILPDLAASSRSGRRLMSTIRTRCGTHFAVPAKQVLVIYCPGAVSHVDTFDHKPALEKQHGKRPITFPRSPSGPLSNVAKAFWDFKPRGQTGKMVSDLLPNLAAMTDDFCFSTRHTETAAHPQGENFLTPVYDGGFSVLWCLGDVRARHGECRSSGVRGHQRSTRVGPLGQEQLAAAFCRRPFREPISPQRMPDNLKRPEFKR